MSGRVVFALGLLALAAQSYALAGRPPDFDGMRGLGPVSLGGLAACEAIVVAAIGITWRRVRRQRRAATLAVLCLAASIAALGVLIRYPLAGIPEFPHRPFPATVEMIRVRASIFRMR